VAAKIADYAVLASVTGHITPVLVWLPGDRREIEVRRALAAARSPAVPVLTGHGTMGLGPADAAWLPLDTERRVTLRTALLSCTRETEPPDRGRPDAR
jgi:hypothetical protein